MNHIVLPIGILCFANLIFRFIVFILDCLDERKE